MRTQKDVPSTGDRWASGAGQQRESRENKSVSWVQGERLGMQLEPEVGCRLKVLGTMQTVENSFPVSLLFC